MKKRLGVLAIALFISTAAFGACEFLTESLPTFFVGVPVNFQISACCGTAPYTFTITSGSLPAGLSMSASGLITGTPTTTGYGTVFIKLTDANGCHVTQAFATSVE